MDFITQNWGYIASALLAISEIVAQIPAVKGNSIAQVIMGLIKTYLVKK